MITNGITKVKANSMLLVLNVIEKLILIKRSKRMKNKITIGEERLLNLVNIASELMSKKNEEVEISCIGKPRKGMSTRAVTMNINKGAKEDIQK